MCFSSDKEIVELRSPGFAVFIPLPPLRESSDSEKRAALARSSPRFASAMRSPPFSPPGSLRNRLRNPQIREEVADLLIV